MDSGPIIRQSRLSMTVAKNIGGKLTEYLAGISHWNKYPGRFRPYISDVNVNVNTQGRGVAIHRNKPKFCFQNINSFFYQTVCGNEL